MSFAGSALVVPAGADASSSSRDAPSTGAASRDGATGSSPVVEARSRGRHKKKVSRKPPAKTTTDAASRARISTPRAKRRRAAGGQRALAAAGHGPLPIAKLGALPPLVPSPGPRSTPEALRAQDQASRGQIERAASAARRPALTDRWQTVSFLLSGVDGARYPEATFWRALAAYRRGDLDGGDKIRLQSSPLAPADAAVLDGERSTANALAARAQGNVTGTEDEGTSVAAQPGAPGFRRVAYVAGASRPPGVPNDTPYTGPAPTASAPSVAAN